MASRSICWIIKFLSANAHIAGIFRFHFRTTSISKKSQCGRFIVTLWLLNVCKPYSMSGIRFPHYLINSHWNNYSVLTVDKIKEQKRKIYGFANPVTYTAQRPNFSIIVFSRIANNGEPSKRDFLSLISFLLSLVQCDRWLRIFTSRRCDLFALLLICSTASGECWSLTLAVIDVNNGCVAKMQKDKNGGARKIVRARWDWFVLCSRFSIQLKLDQRPIYW